MKLIGYIPGQAVRLAEALSRGDSIGTFTERLRNSVLKCLKDDKAFFEPELTAHFLKFLTIRAAGGIEEIELLKSLHLSLADLPWTMLKMEKQTETEKIMAVSPLCKEVIESYIATTSDTWKQVVNVFILKFVCLTFSCGKINGVHRNVGILLLYFSG